MQVLITGAAGFVGQLVAERLLSERSYTVLLIDIVDPPIPKGAKYPENAKTAKVDLCEAAESVVKDSLDAAFVFHGIMSAGSEANFDLGMKVNIDATRSLLEAFRAKKPGIRVIYSSSQAVYGLPLPEVIDESVVPTPQTSYGAEKLICETLVNEYSRRDFIDGIILRFPTISVRPGKPTAAASSFLSGMIREPLDGIESVVPLEDRSFTSWLCSPRTLVTNLMHALTIPTAKLEPHFRVINSPGIGVTIQEMMDALAKVGGDKALSLVKERRDAEMEKILRTWPTKVNNKKAYDLGFQADNSFEQAVIDYKQDLG
ncbi:MAG: hypothetical protein Q9227_001512 [Pyrenula ochraceoflavens]